jgi:16S rRNA (cytosine967-C5)-methyltransferase
VRPGARLKTISDLLPEILGSATAADRLVQEWGRQNRFAGAADRRDIADQIFAILRHYSKLCALVDSTDPVLVTLAARRVLFGDTLDEIYALADGSRHALDLPTQDMRARLVNIAERDKNLEPHERVGLPAWLYREVMAGDVKAADHVLAKLTDRAPLDLRVNTLRGSLAQARQKLADEGVRTRVLKKIPLALRVEGAGQITSGVVFQSGRVEIQDAGAQIAAALCQAQPGQRVLDFCAGAGGKTLALAAQMQNQGRLYVHDQDPQRMRPMAARLKRAGIGIVHSLDAAAQTDLVGRCQLVVADVPCTGSGRWRRAPETKWQLTPERLDALVAVQQEILAESARYVAPGGRLAYITCSIIGRENGQQISAFLQTHPEFETDATAKFADQNALVHLDPHNTDTDGMFCAIMQRTRA